VIRTLTRLFAEREAPRFIRSDNGPEFIARAIRTWLATSGVETLYIEPGAPWENGWAESFHGKLRDELLNAELFTSVLEAKVLTEAYRVEFNQRRPHSALGYRTPAAFAAGLGGSAPGPRLLPLRGKRAAGLEIEPDSHKDWYINRGQVKLLGRSQVEFWTPPDLFHPLGTWTVAAHTPNRYAYHSSAFLLPDGSIFIGGQVKGDWNDPNSGQYQIYKPPYFFKGPRPAITFGPDCARYNTAFSLYVDDTTTSPRCACSVPEPPRTVGT
jgi:putative transposase